MTCTEIQRTPMSDFGCLCSGNCNQYLIKQKYKFHIKKFTGYWFLKQLLAPYFQVWKNKVSLSFVVTWAEALATSLWRANKMQRFLGACSQKAPVSSKFSSSTTCHFCIFFLLSIKSIISNILTILGIIIVYRSRNGIIKKKYIYIYIFFYDAHFAEVLHGNNLCSVECILQLHETICTPWVLNTIKCPQQSSDCGICVCMHTYTHTHTHKTKPNVWSSRTSQIFSCVVIMTCKASCCLQTSSTLTVSQFPQSEELDKFRLSRMFWYPTIYQLNYSTWSVHLCACISRTLYFIQGVQLNECV